MNLSLCEKLGWERGQCDGFSWIQNLRLGFYKEFQTGALEIHWNRELPNHFSDSPYGLWACHEAEKTLMPKQLAEYSRHINELTLHNHWRELGERYCQLVSSMTATAPQRALALYRTLCHP